MFFLERKKRILGPKSACQQEVKRPFLRNPAGTKSIVNVGRLSGDPNGAIKFRRPWSKIKGTYIGDWEQAQNGPNPR